VPAAESGGRLLLSGWQQCGFLDTAKFRAQKNRDYGVPRLAGLWRACRGTVLKNRCGAWEWPPPFAFRRGMPGMRRLVVGPFGGR
jgi:hypothetical protein